MSQREVAIVGKNNTKAAVTGQEELLVKVNSSVPLTITGTVATTGTAGVQKSANYLRLSGVNTAIGAAPNRITFSSVGTASAFVLGNALKPGETISFEAGAPSNYFAANAFVVNTSTAGAELLVTWVD